MTLGVTFLLDETGDLAFEDGRFQMGISVAQIANLRLQRIRGEWFADTDAGIDYLNFVYVKDPNLDHIKSIFRKELEETPGIGDIDKFEVSFDPRTRRLEIRWEAGEDSGELVKDVGTPRQT